jgi:CHAT domain-containing protein
MRSCNVITDLTVIAMFDLFYFRDGTLNTIYFSIYQFLLALLSLLNWFYDVFTAPIKSYLNNNGDSTFFFLVVLAFFLFPYSPSFEGKAMTYLITILSIELLCSYLLLLKKDIAKPVVLSNCNYNRCSQEAQQLKHFSRLKKEFDIGF